MPKPTETPDAAPVTVHKKPLAPEDVGAYLDAQEKEYERDLAAAKGRAAQHASAAETEFRNVERIAGAIGQIREMRAAMKPREPEEVAPANKV